MLAEWRIFFVREWELGRAKHLPNGGLAKLWHSPGRLGLRQWLEPLIGTVLFVFLSSNLALDLDEIFGLHGCRGGVYGGYSARGEELNRNNFRHAGPVRKALLAGCGKTPFKRLYRGCTARSIWTIRECVAG